MSIQFTLVSVQHGVEDRTRLGRVAVPAPDDVRANVAVRRRAEAARRLVALMPHAELELLPAGHAPWLDDLERCATLTASFLGRA